MGGFQAGMDVWRKRHGDGSRDIAGFYLGYGRATADVHAVLAERDAGTASMDAYSLGATGHISARPAGMSTPCFKPPATIRRMAIRSWASNSTPLERHWPLRLQGRMVRRVVAASRCAW